MRTIEKTEQFHRAFGQDCPEKPTLPKQSIALLRVHLLLEETGELAEALAGGDLLKVFDGLIDIQYVLDGAQLAFGLRGVDFGTARAASLGAPQLPSKPLQVLQRVQLGVHTICASLAAEDLTMLSAGIQQTQFGVDWAVNACSLGGAFPEGFDEVHRSNMSKLDFRGEPILSPAGRVVKGPGYSPPDLAPILLKHGAVLPQSVVLYREQTARVRNLNPGGIITLDMLGGGASLDVPASDVSLVRASV